VTPIEERKAFAMEAAEYAVSGVIIHNPKGYCRNSASDAFSSTCVARTSAAVFDFLLGDSTARYVIELACNMKFKAGTLETEAFVPKRPRERFEV
jgi:hypothetical protein